MGEPIIKCCFFNSDAFKSWKNDDGHLSFDEFLSFLEVENHKEIKEALEAFKVGLSIFGNQAVDFGTKC